MLRRRNCQAGIDKGRATFDVHQVDWSGTSYTRSSVRNQPFSRACLPQRLQKAPAVLIVLEDGASLLASCHRVIGRPEIFDPQRSRHAASIRLSAARQAQTTNFLGPLIHANASPFILIGTPSLDLPATWPRVSGGITVNGTNDTITINASSGNEYYKLTAP